MLWTAGMMQKQRTSITVETSEVLIFKSTRSSASPACARCAGTSGMQAATAVAAACRVSARQISEWVEADKVHGRPSPEGVLLVCLDSLLANLSGPNKPR